jgi:hypothetical protein
MLSLLGKVCDSKWAFITISLVVILTVVDSEFIKLFYGTDLDAPGSYHLSLFLTFVIITSIINVTCLRYVRINDTEARTSRPVKEIKSWKEFECVLRDESAVLFNKMLSECGQNRDYVRAVISKGENYSAESLFMLLVLQQQMMINELIPSVRIALAVDRSGVIRAPYNTQ